MSRISGLLGYGEKHIVSRDATRRLCSTCTELLHLMRMTTGLSLVEATHTGNWNAIMRHSQILQGRSLFRETVPYLSWHERKPIGKWAVIRRLWLIWIMRLHLISTLFTL